MIAQQANMITDNLTPTVMIAQFNVKLVKMKPISVPLVLETESEFMNVTVTKDFMTSVKLHAHHVITNVRHVKHRPTNVLNVFYQEIQFQLVTVQLVCMKPLT